MTAELSVVRQNLLTQRGYAPYCGNEKCPRHWPRTEYRFGQFECACGWRSEFEPTFIEKVQKFNKVPK